MKNTLIVTSTLVAAASAFAQSATATSGLSYNSIHAYYAGSNNQDSLVVDAQAQLGTTNFFVNAGFEANSGKSSLSGYNDRQVSIDLGYKLTVGPGDLNFTVGYVQDQELAAAYPDASNGLALGAAWRQKINQSFEYIISYQHISGSISSNGVKSANNDDAIAAEVRYYFTPKFDLALGYQWDKSTGSSSKGNSTWFVGVGYNF
jgi:hypothetical protein